MLSRKELNNVLPLRFFTEAVGDPFQACAQFIASRIGFGANQYDNGKDDNKDDFSGVGHQARPLARGVTTLPTSSWIKSNLACISLKF